MGKIKLTDKQKQEKLDKFKRPLYISGVYTVPDLAEVIKRVMVDKESTCYCNPIFGKIQCHNNSCRSMDDVYRVAKTYIPGITYSQVKRAVRSLYGVCFGASYCYMVRKTVHTPYLAQNPDNGNVIRKCLDKQNLNIKCQNKKLKTA